MTAEEETYRIYQETLASQPPPYKWDDGSIVQPADYALFFLERVFTRFYDEGRVSFFQLFGLREKSIDEAVTDSLSGGSRSEVGHLLAERMEGRTMTTGVLAGKTLQNYVWPVVLRGLPNPSNIAWAYSPKRNDYAGAFFVAEEPKGFMKKGRPPGTLRCGLSSDFRKIMQELRPH